MELLELKRHECRACQTWDVSAALEQREETAAGLCRGGAWIPKGS